MKHLTAMFMAMSMTCAATAQQGAEADPIGPANVKIENGIMTPEVLWAFGRVGNLCVSPDGQQAAFTVTYYSIAENKSNSDIYVMNADGNNRRQLTRTAARESELTWHPDGKSLLFLRNGALWSIDPASGTETQLSAIEQPIDGYRMAPKADRVALAITVKLENYQGNDVYPDLDKSNARIYGDLMYRHWDTWRDGTYNHIFVATADANGRFTNADDIMAGEPYDAPLKPFGGMDDVAWSPDGQTLIYTCKKFTGKEYAFQTNSNLYRYDLATKQTVMLTPNMPGYDKHPMFSPDGTKLLWLSMERAGYEADKERILILDLKTNERRDVSTALDASPSSIVWTPDGKTLYLTAPVQEAHQLFSITVKDGKVKQLTTGDHDYQQVQLAGNNAVLALHTTTVKPAEVYRIDLKTGKGTELSFVNRELLAQLKLPTLEKRFITTTDNKQMVTWVIYPPAFDPTKKYPVLQMCTGGPQGALSPSFSYRWSYMLMASQGYVVVVPARRGTSGSGQAWADAISRNHGTQDEQDLLAATDAIRKEPWAGKIGAMGASYGGYSVFHLAGTHQKRYSAFLAHCGIFQMDFMYKTTEEMFFEEWETGGAPWDTDNKVAQNSYAHSPHLLVKNWDTPIMVVHGERDYRVPYSQGMAAYNTAQMLGIESRLLLFPTENHWVLGPQNALVWQREFFKWFDKHLKQ